MRAAKQWIVDTYGYDLYERALRQLAENDRSIVDSQILASTLYPVATWDRFLRNVRSEVKAATGESEETFDRRNVRESGSRALRMVYGFILELFHPKSVVPRIGMLFERLISTASVEVIENTDGRCQLRLSAPAAFRENIRHHFPPSIELLIELARGREVKVVVARDEIQGRRTVMDILVTYVTEQP